MFNFNFTQLDMKIKITKILVLFFFLAYASFSFAQEDKAKVKNDFWQKVYVGGNLGLQFGTITFVDVSPLAGYKVTKDLSLGVGLTYLYYQYYSSSFNVYGGRFFGKYNITESIFAHTEFEVLNRQHPYISGERLNVTNVLVGGGYRQAIGANSYFNILALWNLNESEYSLYSNPIIRAGVIIGL